MLLFRKFRVNKDERALLFDRGDFVEILRPGEHVRFDPLRRLAIEKFALAKPRFERSDIAIDFRVPAELVPQLVEFTGNGFKAKVPGAQGVYGVQVPQFHVAVLYVDGKLEYLLEPGLRAFFDYGRNLRVEFVDLRLQVLEVA